MGSMMKRQRPWPFLFLAAGFFAILGTCPGLGAPPEKAADRQPVFVGYLFRQPSKVNYGLYTHLCHAFLVADEDGKVRTSRTVPSRSLTTEAHKAGVKVLISLGGWGWDKQFAAIVSKQESMDRYVKSVMEMIDGYDYDGIDLDWEYPDTAEEIPGFERLVRRFRSELDELGREEGQGHGSDHGGLVQSGNASVAEQGGHPPDDGLVERHDV